MMIFDAQELNTEETCLIGLANGEFTDSGRARSDTYIMVSGGPIGEADVSMRFVIRNKSDDKKAPGLVIAVVMHANGLLVGVQKCDAEDGYATRRIIEGLSAALTRGRVAEGVPHVSPLQVTVTLPQRKSERDAVLSWFDGDPQDAWASERLRIMSENVILRLADPEEASPLPVPSVDPLAPLFQAPVMPEMADMFPLMNALERRLRSDPNGRTFSVRDDIARRDQCQYVFDADRWTSPRTAVVGAAGSGKSSLISALIDMAGHDLPPSGLSRTTLCPIAFHNDSKIENFRLEVECHSLAHVKAAVRERLEEAALAALPGGVVLIGDRAARLLARSDDNTFDMRLMFGRMKRGNAVWEEILQMFNATLEDIRQDPDPQTACETSFMIDIISEDITHRIFGALRSLDFGKMKLRPNGTPERFGYAARTRIGMIEAGRRFFSASMRHAGKSFAPLCKRITFRGQFVEARDFMLVDNRGFDHEGDLAQAAAADIMREVDAADRVMVIEDAAKVGSRATMELIAQIVASGNGQKVFFVQSKADTVLDKGIDLTQHVQSGLSNGLAALRSRVGDLAIATLEQSVTQGIVYHFGNLDQFDIPQGGLVNAMPDEDLGVDNAREARRMFYLMATDPDAGPVVDIAALQPQYDANLIDHHVSAATRKAAEGISARYGLAGENAGADCHWGTIKAENRRVATLLSANDPDILSSDIAAMSWLEAVAIAENMSLMLDRPQSWQSMLEGMDDATLAAAQETVKAELRRNLAHAIHREVARTTLWTPRQVWREAFALSQVTFGPKSTYERGRMLRTISDCLPVMTPHFTSRIAEDLAASGALCSLQSATPTTGPVTQEDANWEAFFADNWNLTEDEMIAASTLAASHDADGDTKDESEGDFDHA